MNRADWLSGVGGLLLRVLTAFAIYYALKKQRKLHEEREAKNMERQILENTRFPIKKRDR